MPDLLPALSLSTGANRLGLWGAVRGLWWLRHRELCGWDM